MLELAIVLEREFQARAALKRAALFAESLLIWPESFIIAKRTDYHGIDYTDWDMSYKLIEPSPEPGLDDELIWLKHQGFVRAMVAWYEIPGRSSVTALGGLFDNPVMFGNDAVASIVNLTESISTHDLRTMMPRIAALSLRDHGTDAVALYDQPVNNSRPAGSADVTSTALRIALAALPTPGELTSWDEIFEYRGDNRTRVLSQRYFRWIRDLPSGRYRPREIEQEIREAIFEYEQHFEQYRFSSSRTGFECLISVPVEIAENLVKFKWSEAVRSLFFLKRQRAELLAAEQSAPHREVAYVLDAQRRFSSR